MHLLGKARKDQSLGITLPESTSQMGSTGLYWFVRENTYITAAPRRPSCRKKKSFVSSETSSVPWKQTAWMTTNRCRELLFSHCAEADFTDPAADDADPALQKDIIINDTTVVSDDEDDSESVEESEQSGFPTSTTEDTPTPLHLDRYNIILSSLSSLSISLFQNPQAK